MNKKSNPAFACILRSVRQLKLLSVGIVLTAAGAIIAALLPPLVLEKAINLLAVRQSVPFLLGLSYFALLALTGLLESVREFLLTIFGQKITHQLRSRLCGKLSRLPADAFVSTDPGVTVSRFTGDVDTVETLFTSGIISMFADVCRVISIFVILFLKNRGLALFLLAVIPLIYLFTRTVQKRTLAAQKANRVAVGREAAHIPETIACIRTIHTMRAERYMEESYDCSLKDSFAAIERTNFYDSIYSPVILILNAVIVAVVMILAAAGNSDIQSFFGMSVGTAVAVISYISQVFSPIESIGMEIQTIQSAAAGMHRINEFLLQEELPLPSAESGKISIEPQICIELQDLVFAYRDGQTVLDHLVLTVREGEHVTITGRTGAGKSTIFKLLLGLYRPQAGKVLIYGKAADHIPDSEKRSMFGCVEQFFYRIPGTVMDQIRLSDTRITEEQVYAAAKTAGIHEAIMSLPQGYQTPCSEAAFSHGQWQLLSIARAIAPDPKILLLDEITANLDADTEQIILNALKKAAKNRTVLSISHRLYESMGGREFVLK